MAENRNNCDDNAPPSPTLDGTLSEHSSADSAEETNHSNSENFKAVKIKTTKMIDIR